MATFSFELVSPEALLISEEVEAVRLPGAMGEFQVMAEHAPLLALLDPGVLVVSGGGSSERRIFIDGGFCDVNASGCTVLAEMASPVEELDASRVDALISEAEAADETLDNPARQDEMARRLAILKTVRGTL